MGQMIHKKVAQIIPKVTGAVGHPEDPPGEPKPNEMSKAMASEWNKGREGVTGALIRMAPKFARLADS